MKIEFNSNNYSREVGFFTVIGKGALSVGNGLCSFNGISCAEWDEEYNMYSVAYSKAHWTKEGIKDLYKKVKNNCK